jgi:para-nitrobenzyl esterase
VTAVETRSGRLRGVERRGVLAFRGIPYAAPPTGARRFRAPAPAEPWPGVRVASEPGPGAPQRGGTLGGAFARIVGPGSTSEDCLTLDLWTPRADGARRPVLVWIHGGAFVMGAGSALAYSGAALARRGDVVVVTANYRLGALGFLQLGDVAPGAGFDSNLGLLDQIAALEWVRDNVAAFGGDPANVTVFGESAGGMSVGTLLGTPRARGLFARAIAQSGAAHNTQSRAGAARVATTFLAALGLAPAEAGRLREAPVPALLDAQLVTVAKLGLAYGTLPFEPAVDGDLLPGHPLDAIAKGSARGVPLLVGTNRDEWNLFLLADAKARVLDEDGLLRRYARSLGPDDVPRAHALYREALLTASPRARWAAYQTHRVFTAPADRLAELQAVHAPSYAYLFTWSPPLVRSRVGACHALEVPLVFGTFRHPLLRGLYLGGASSTAAALQRAWLAFARTGCPETGGSWLTYSAANRTPHVLGGDDRGARDAFERVRPFWAERGHGSRV